MNKLHILGLHVSFKYNPRLKNSYINILPSTEIVVKSPIKKERYIHDLIAKKYEWIQKKLQYIKKYETVSINIEDEVLLFGEVYSIDHDQAAFLRTKLLRLKIADEKALHRAYESFYKEMALSYIPQRVEYFSQKMGLYSSNIKFRKMKRRWGSCDSKRELTFNTHLLKLSPELIDYVIVHELSHIAHMNHSQQFHALLRRYLPQAKQLEIKLKEQYHRFMVK